MTWFASIAGRTCKCDACGDAIDPKVLGASHSVGIVARYVGRFDEFRRSLAMHYRIGDHECMIHFCFQTSACRVAAEEMVKAIVVEVAAGRDVP